MGFFQALAIQAGLWALIALGLTLVVRSGVYSLASASFYLVGAYTTAIGSVYTTLSHLSLASLGAVLAAGLGLLCVLPAARVREDQLLLVTLAFAEGLRQLAFGWRELTGGSTGISGVPSLVVAGHTLGSGSAGLAATVWGTVLVALALVAVLLRSPWGLRVDLIREDELGAAALGIPAFRYRYATHSAGAALAALSGSLYAHYLGFVSPTPFGVSLSVFILGALVLGGLGRPLPGVIAAAAVSSLQPLIQLVGASTFNAAAIRQVVVGALLTATIVTRALREEAHARSR